jgi:hypothetical protein
MRLSLKHILLACSVFLSASVMAQQDIDAHSPKPNSGNAKQRQSDKKKEEQRKKNDKAVEKGKKQHMKNQSKSTRKMMKKSKHSSEMWNGNKKKPFYKRMFQKK